MDFNDNEGEAAFRAEVRAWLGANAPKRVRGAGRQQHMKLADARVWQISLQFSPSPPDEQKTVTSAPGSMPARVAASSPSAMASLLIRPARRRSAEGSTAGEGSSVAPGTYAMRPVKHASAVGQSRIPGPITEIPSR